MKYRDIEKGVKYLDEEGDVVEVMGKDDKSEKVWIRWEDKFFTFDASRIERLAEIPKKVPDDSLMYMFLDINTNYMSTCPRSIKEIQEMAKKSLNKYRAVMAFDPKRQMARADFEDFAVNAYGTIVLTASDK